MYGILLVTGNQTHQENYAQAFAADARCRLIAVTDEADVDPRRRALNEQLADRLKLPYLADLGEALKREDVDVVSNCAPPERRGRIAIRCADAGKHLYLDKPLVPRLAEADALVAAVRKAGIKSHMFSHITQGWAMHAKRLVDSKRLGKLRAVHADAFFAKGRTGTARLGALRKEEYPPGRHQMLLAKREFDNVGVYPITLVSWLAGSRFRSVYALTGNYFFKEHQQANVEDFGLLSATLEDSTLVSIAAGRYGWNTHPAAGRNQMVLVGSERAVVVDMNRPRVEVYSDEPPWLPPKDPHPEDPMAFWSSTTEESGAKPKQGWVNVGPTGRSDASYFIDCLAAGRDSDMSVAAAAHGTEVLLAAYRSAATGEVVTLPLPR